MDAFWTGDFHYHMSVSKSKAWSQGFGWWVLPSGGEGRLPMLQSRLETRATSSCSIVGCLLTWGLKYRVQSRSPNICPQAWSNSRLAARISVSQAWSRLILWSFYPSWLWWNIQVNDSDLKNYSLAIIMLLSYGDCLKRRSDKNSKTYGREWAHCTWVFRKDSWKRGPLFIWIWKLNGGGERTGRPKPKIGLGGESMARTT